MKKERKNGIGNIKVINEVRNQGKKIKEIMQTSKQTSMQANKKG